MGPSTSGAVAMYAIGILGIRRFKFADAQETGLFKTVAFVLLNNLGWSLILVHMIVRDLRDKMGVAPVFRFIGWALFRTSLDKYYTPL